MQEQQNDENDDELDEEGDDEEFEEPAVVLTTLAELSQWLPAPIAKSYGDRPVWFVLEDDNELIGLFDRIPEDPMPKKLSDTILGGIRAFAEEKSDDLQELLGVTDSIAYGFHVDARMKDVRVSFEDDGFEVVGSIRKGEVVAEGEEGEG